MSIINVTVTNWNKYNPKRDQATYSWLRLNNDIAFESKLHGLSPAQKYVWILILCECSRANNAQFDLNVDHLSHISGVSVGEIEKLLHHLTENGLVTTAGGRARSSVVAATTPTNERTNETNERTRESALATPLGSPLPRLIELWNENCGELAKVRKTNKPRSLKIARRWPENDDLEWVKVIQRVATSRFCTGHNDRGWKATFDWLLQPETHLKVSEGKYDNKQVKSSKDVSDADWEAIFGEKRSND